MYSKSAVRGHWFAVVFSFSLLISGFFAQPGYAQSVVEVKPAAEGVTGYEEPGMMTDIVLGDETATVTIYEYASLTCIHCSNFHNNVLPHLKENYIDKGKVKLILRAFPLDPTALLAASVARCKSDLAYYPIVGAIYKDFHTWTRASNPLAGLLTVFEQLGIDKAAVRACLDNKELVDNIRNDANEASRKLGVNSTPTFFINGNKYDGGLTKEQVDAILTPLVDQQQ